jgi:hypothetical protein
MTLNPTPPAPVLALGLGADVVVIGPDPSTDTRVRLTLEALPLAATLLLDPESAQQLVDQLPALLADPIASAKRTRSGLTLPAEKPRGILRG